MMPRTSPALARTADWLAQRSDRERVLLGVMAALCLVAVGWYGVVLPVTSARATALERIALHQSLQARLRSAPTGGAAASSQTALADGPLVEAARAAAAAQGLSAEIEGDADRITVVVAAARFDAALPFLAGVEAGGAELTDVRMRAGAQPGLVDLSFTATRP